MQDKFLTSIDQTLQSFLRNITTLKGVIIIAVAAIIAYLLSRYIGHAIISLAQVIAVRSDNTSNDTRFIQLKRVETYLGIAVALVRGFIVFAVAYLAWRMIDPATSGSFTAATIGASAFFIVVASGTVGPLLRDVTAGSVMIIEKWFSVGDFIRLEPFMDVNGVVERMTLRSTKLRNLNGEVIWLHNQYIQGAKVTPWGVRTIAVDIFVNNVETGRKLVEEVAMILPIHATMLARKITITKIEELTNKLWKITVVGQTAPGREWLIDNFFVDSLNSADTLNDKKVIVYAPLVRYADEMAEKRFKRAVRVKRAK